MEQRYRGVISRTLDRTERRVPINEEETPLVIEPLQSPHRSFLREFLKCYSSQIIEDLAKHGALLLRGFAVDSAGDFEQYIHSIRGMCGVREILCAEAGRTLVDGTTSVFYTNKLVKTGGTLQFGTFHTENYFIPDVPHYVSFWCETPCKLGGETGMVNTAKVYADLPDTLKRKLEERTCLVSLIPITEIIDRYGVSAEIIIEFFERAGLPVVTVQNVPHLAIYKPTVVQHPLNHERALLVNFFGISSLERPLLNAFLTDYSGRRWLMHRLFWKTAWLRHMVTRVTLRRYQTKSIFVTQAPPPPLTDTCALAGLFSVEDVARLATIMRRRYSSFLWRRGDILILDNLKIAHNGMAGRGKRELRVMLCNPVPLPYSSTSSGLHIVAPLKESTECLAAQLVHLRDLQAV